MSTSVGYTRYGVARFDATRTAVGSVGSKARPGREPQAIKPTDRARRAYPIVLLSGGPGNSALDPDAFAEMASRFGAMRQGRDIILFDQRGVGASFSQLDCTVVSPPEESHRADLVARYLAETGMETIAEDNSQAECVRGGHPARQSARGS